MALDLIAELESILAARGHAQIEYAVCGGIAMSIHGHVRATKDIDLLVRAVDVARVTDLAHAER